MAKRHADIIVLCEDRAHVNFVRHHLKKRGFNHRQNEIAEVGRSLAAKHGFAYPEAFEQTARQSWTAREHLLRSDGISDTT